MSAAVSTDPQGKAQATAQVASQRGKRIGFARHLKLYIDAVKPGIVMSNTLVTAAAYTFATRHFDPVVFLALILGTACIIGSACVVNNHFDREIDARMARTAGRGQVTGFISPFAATAYSYVLGIAGVTILGTMTNSLTCVLGVIGWVTYALVYTWSKHHTVHSTLIGTVPGAIPPVAGLTAGGLGLGWEALALFLLLVAWQLVHFFAISIRRRDDYAAAGVPVAAVAYGVTPTKRLILATAILNLAANVLMVFGAHISVWCSAVLLVFAVYWLVVCALGQRAKTDAIAWASRVFKISLLDIMLICAVLVIEPWLR
ncbi:heme o synthase [Brevibacterium sp. 50QC2O2]|jgi:protoheme IX farnesyltransferase|uniref:heme o synthase n=1 Tax=Brevibacterium TaxID=1696 RepID=UPI00211C71F2|nr:MULTISPECIES: heme o synthase [unclassified Brevibacterium]MCQ9368075.1 heme o synthase [Brevibacterium sp. 91QC2O2]MCQ9385277.1 heme o synthase [Brevibacterium sp. 68QC2CO]MCQ9388783.1 heme o synthase [Brevibacterium sp. 50QC2O2]